MKIEQVIKLWDIVQEQQGDSLTKAVMFSVLFQSINQPNS